MRSPGKSSKPVAAPFADRPIAPVAGSAIPASTIPDRALMPRNFNACMAVAPDDVADDRRRVDRAPPERM
ncbi:hypothetical protein SY2F82_73590 [Streptomyces sp. Y2F8-2]|nr:hypothetical protein SY2F82_73590 [Streptomyces sp. Y2F8-2]